MKNILIYGWITWIDRDTHARTQTNEQTNNSNTKKKKEQSGRKQNGIGLWSQAKKLLKSQKTQFSFSSFLGLHSGKLRSIWFLFIFFLSLLVLHRFLSLIFFLSLLSIVFFPCIHFDFILFFFCSSSSPSLLIILLLNLIKSGRFQSYVRRCSRVLLWKLPLN